MSDVEQKRARLMECYGPSWREKVKKMSDNQVIAIFRKFQLKGLIK